MTRIEKQLYKSIAEKIGTPCYVYDKDKIIQNFQRYQKAFSHVHYAVKANSNLAVLSCLAKQGAGFDIVSGGELARVLKAGGKAERIVFSGVGKQNEEIAYALEENIACFNVESLFELHQIQAIAKKLHKKANIALRINPNISVKTHPYITTGLKQNKFGITGKDIIEGYLTAKKYSHLNIIGIACHLGSQILSEKPYLDALAKMISIKNKLEKANIKFSHIDIGGGFGITHQKKFDIQRLAKKIQQIKKISRCEKMDIWIEPGRSIIAETGVILTRVISVKPGEKNFVIVDAAMNDLIRPALYGAHHDMTSLSVLQQKKSIMLCDVVGPVCETADFLGKDRKLATEENDILMIDMAGAYGFSMSSNYNSRPRSAEVMLESKQKKYTLIRERETIDDLMAKEICLTQ